MTFSDIGRWWQKNEEIDLVALDEENETIWLGECKWSINPVGEDIYRNLQRKTRLVVWGKESRRERFILFSRSGFTDGMRKLAIQDDVQLVYGWDA
jgi:AAA+ ATPase superfamily predicted ATPase